MPCKVQIKENLTNKISADTDSGYNRSIEGARAIAKEVNQQYGVPVVFFNLEGDFIVRDITIPDSLVDRYYEHELALEQQNKTPGEQLTMFQKGEEESKTLPPPASPKTIALIKDFAKAIGVDINAVKDINIDGEKIDAQGAALLMQNLIQVVDGKEAQALPEEAMHFAVAIVKQTNPALYKKLLSEINDYAILKDVFTEYGTDKRYQTTDGKPDVLKIKEEAIAKVLVSTVLKMNEGLTEGAEKIAKVESWWQQILNYLHNLFSTSGFDQLSMDIISGKNIGTAEAIKEDGIFLQQSEKSKQDRVYDSIKDLGSKITEETDGSGYSINGNKIKRRVSDLVNDWYERKFREQKQLTDTEFDTAITDLKAEKGTAGHADLENAFALFVDGETGLLRSTALSDDGYVSQLNPDNRDMYELLRNNLKKRLISFPKGTKFMSEATIYDAKRDIAGKVDFLAITPEGKVSILDWKFMDLNTETNKDIPWYKFGAWNTQMDQYKYIISSAYNVKNEDFEQTRMIPIKAEYTKADYRNEVLPKLTGVKIGDINVQNITEDYLLPVPLKGEKTDNKKIDALLAKFNSAYEKLSNEKVTSEQDKENKKAQLNALFTAIRQLQIKTNIAPLINQTKVLNKKIQNIIDTYNDKFEGEDAIKFDDAEISEFTARIRVASEALDIYTNLDSALRFLFQGKELTKEDEELRDDLRKAVDEARDYRESLDEIDTKFTVEFIGGTENAEKVVQGISKYFGNTATIQLESTQTLFKKANKAFGFMGMDTQTEVKRLTQFKSSYQKWAKSKGLSIRNEFDIIKKKDKNELIDQFDPKFYSELRTKVKEKDFKWIRENVDKEAYKEYLDKKKKTALEQIDANREHKIGSEAQINAEVLREKTKANDLYSISTPESLGWLLTDDVLKFPNKDKWESNEWKELHKPENKPALDFYDYIIERNNYFREIGYINAKQARTFLPWIRKQSVEKIIFGGKMSLGEQFLRNISVDETDVGLGQLDPINGKPIDTIPIYFTKEFEGEVSTDLFKNMFLYNEFAIKFKYLSDIEEQGRALLRLEKNKKSIATSYFGKTQYKDGIIQENPDNSENTKLYEDMMKAIIYQQKFITSETFDQVLGKMGKFGEKINNKLGFKLLPEHLEDRQISVNKVINQLNNTFQLNALGLNVLSSASNLFGGSVQSIINAGTYFTKAEHASTYMWILGNKMGGSDKQKMLAALDYFIPFTENYNKHAASKLSLSKLNDQALQEYLMVLMRKGEEAVQVVNFFSFFRNTVVVDGKLVNARQYLKETEEYKEFYKGTTEERKAREEKFEKDVKALNEEKGVLGLSTLENGELVIPGIDRKSDTVIELRRKVQQFTSDALGSLTEENKRLLNLNIYGNSFMVFKNWIPRLIDVRTGNLKYNAASDAYEWGRTRMLYRVITEDFMGSLDSLQSAILGNDQKFVDQISALYEKKRADYENDTGKNLKMTESQFIDLVKQNLKNQLVDVIAFATLLALYVGLKANAPGDEEDPIVKNQYKFLLKAVDKFRDEVTYFYDPTSLTGLVSTGIFPSVGLIQNIKKGITNFMIENYALAVGNEELAKKNYVIKYWLKSFPVASQGSALLPIFYPNLAKDLGIKMQSTSGIR